MLTKPLGPVHEYEAMPAGPPVKLKALPAQTGPLLEAVATGNALTVALVVIVLEQVPLFTVKEYTPDIATVAFADTVGLC